MGADVCPHFSIFLYSVFIHSKRAISYRMTLVSSDTRSFMLMLLMAMALMAGCGKGSILPRLGEDGRGVPQALLLAESLMSSRPDSALAVLDVTFETMTV